MDRSPIEITLERINKAYYPGTLGWMKANRPEEWRKIIAIESDIDQAAIGGDEAGLTRALNEYKCFILKMVNTFMTPKGKMTGLF
jgi:hypothetical protein